MAPMIRHYADPDHDAVYDRLGFRALDVEDAGPVVYLGLAL